MSPFTDYNRILRSWWWVVALSVTIAAGSALVVTARQTPVYRATTTQVVIPNSKVQANSEILRSLDTLDRRSVLATLARIPRTLETREKAAERLGAQLAALGDYAVSAVVLPNTNLIRVEVEGPDPQKSAELANTVALVMQDIGREMYRIYKIDTLARAIPAAGPIRPSPERNLLAGAAVGLFIGLFAAVLAEHLRSTARLSSHPVEESRSYGS